MKHLIFLLLMAIPTVLNAEAQRALTKTVCLDITPAADTYSSNDAIGGVLEFPNVFAAPVWGGILQSAYVIDATNGTQDMAFCFFNSEPYTTVTSGSTFTLSNDKDLATFLGCADLSEEVSHGFSFRGNTVITRTINTVNNTNLYGVLIAKESVTYSANSKVRVCVEVLQD